MRSFISGCEANKPFGSFASLLRSVELGQRAAEAVGRVADLVGELHALVIRLVLVVAAELVVEDVRVGPLSEVGHERLRHAARRTDRVGRQADRLALLDRVDGVLLGDVDDLVREDAGELGFVLHQPEQALRDVDEAAGRREGVDAFGVEHHELPVEAGPGLCLRQDGADERDVLRDVGVLVDPERLDHLVADLLADLPLLGVGDLQVGDLLDGLRLLQRAGDAAELRGRAAATPIASAATARLSTSAHFFIRVFPHVPRPPAARRSPHGSGRAATAQ